MEGSIIDRAAVTRQLVLNLPRACIPNINHPVCAARGDLHAASHQDQDCSSEQDSPLCSSEEELRWQALHVVMPLYTDITAATLTDARQCARELNVLRLDTGTELKHDKA